MRCTPFALVAILAFWTGSASSQESASGSYGAPPILAPASVGNAPDTIQVGRPVPVSRRKTIKDKVPQQFAVQENGQIVTKTVYVDVNREVTVTESAIVLQTFDVKNVAVYDLKWQRLSGEEIRKALTGKPIPVILVQRPPGSTRLETDRASINPFYLRCFREGTLIVAVPVIAGTQPGLVPAPEPVPPNK